MRGASGWRSPRSDNPFASAAKAKQEAIPEWEAVVTVLRERQGHRRSRRLAATKQRRRSNRLRTSRVKQKRIGCRRPAPHPLFVRSRSLDPALSRATLALAPGGKPFEHWGSSGKPCADSRLETRPEPRTPGPPIRCDGRATPGFRRRRSRPARGSARCRAPRRLRQRLAPRPRPDRWTR